LISVVRETDTMARLGGDEFGMLVELEGEEAGIDALLERLSTVLCKDISLPDGHRVHVGASVGVVIGSGTAEAKELLAQADQAMYVAKGRGGGYEVVRT
jgi:diguanylate cyclase (GGDEF)-like protein